MRRHPRRGVTLAELLVVLVILGVMATVVGLAWPPSRGAATPDGGIAAARRRAAETGRPVPVRSDSGAAGPTLLALPDGRLIGMPPDGVDPLTNHD